MAFILGLAMLIGIVALVAGYAIFRAWLLSKLWLWFIVPLGVAPLSFAHAYGMLLFVGFLVYQDSKADTKEEKQKLAASIVIKDILILVLAYIVKGYL